MGNIDDAKRRAAAAHPVLYTLGAGLAIGAWGFMLWDDWILFPISLAISIVWHWLWLRPGGGYERWLKKQRELGEGEPK